MTVTQLDTLEALRDQRDVDFDEDQQARSLLLRKRHHLTHLLEDSGSNTPIVEHVMFRCPDHVTDGVQLLSVGVQVQTTLSATGGTNYKTLILQKRDDAGANNVSLLAADRDTKTVDLNANVVEAQTLTSTAADLVLAPGEVFTAELTESGTGPAMGKIAIHLVFEEL